MELAREFGWCLPRATNSTDLSAPPAATLPRATSECISDWAKTPRSACSKSSGRAVQPSDWKASKPARSSPCGSRLEALLFHNAGSFADVHQLVSLYRAGVLLVAIGPSNREVGGGGGAQSKVQP